MSKEGAWKTLKWTYKVLRSVIFSAVIIVGTLFVTLYALLSVPPVQDYIKEKARAELETFLGSRVEVEELSILPINEVILKNATVYDLDDEKCLEIGKLGAGINFWRLVTSGEIEITYVELLDFKANIYQKKEGEPLNIDFIVKAFEPKEKNKPSTKFDLKIHNIVLRNGAAEYSKRWKERKADGRFDPDHIAVSGLSADVAIPRLSNDYTEIYLRRLSLTEKSGLQVKEIGGDFIIEPGLIAIRGFEIRLPETTLKLRDFELPMAVFDPDSEKEVGIEIYDSRVTPSNLSAFYPPLEGLENPYPIFLRAKGSLNNVRIERLEIGSRDNIHLSLEGTAENLREKERLRAEIRELALTATPQTTALILELAGLPKNDLITGLTGSAGEIGIEAKGSFEAGGEATADIRLRTRWGEITLIGEGALKDEKFTGDISLATESLNIAQLMPQLPVEDIEGLKATAKGTLDIRNIAASDGTAEITIAEIDVLKRRITNISGEATKERNRYGLQLAVNDDNLNGKLTAGALINGEESEWSLEAEIRDFDTYNSLLEENIGSLHNSGLGLKGRIEAKATGNTADNIAGEMTLRDFTLSKPNGKTLNVDHLTLSIREDENEGKRIDLVSDIASVEIKGEFVPTRAGGFIKELMWDVCPAMFEKYEAREEFGAGVFEIDVTNAEPLIEFFNLPVFPLTELAIKGNFDSRSNRLQMSTDIPYIQQGNKLITDTYLHVDVNGTEGETYIGLGTVYPTKKGLLKTDIDITGRNGTYDLSLDFNRGRNVAFYGGMDIRVILERDAESKIPAIEAYILPSELYLNRDIWDVEEAEIAYDSERLSIENFCIRHGEQFVTINGSNTRQGEGEIRVGLADFNLDNLFETLNIPNVAFGGNATGSISAKNIFSKDPDIRTETLKASSLSYNGAVLGDADLRARLNLPEKMVKIGALIDSGGERVATVDGGIWIGRDSLSFDFDANNVNVGFMQPFMAAFSSDVKGTASGKALLFGKFSDIDMTGTIVTKNTEILIDFINVRYTGSDTVYLSPGKIDIPHMTVRDKYGNTAMVEGLLTHRCFHEPVFTFTLKDMKNLLVYDTNSKINPLWYGTLFASGSGVITGKPGTVTIAADVETSPGSDFTFVLSDQQEAVKSHFLTFSDRKKEAYEASLPKDTVPEFLQRFQDKKQNQADAPSIYNMDFRVSVNEDVRFNLIMDPVGGDKIVAYGDGAMNLTYSSLTDELKIYGKYILEKGSYNFTLQDIILKDFTIEPGSSIAFTGDPYRGILDITAAYRVNTSLTELDQSFANDRELNRTSVPVEALLKVTGILTQPHIGFDIALPTVTEETAQKVRSIISTEDMMSRQVLYLVALNKFYPPEYMATSNTGGEWASIASSTISSQIQNMIGQITDKFTLAPSIRSDKGDFSDIEVDIALSSQLFNDRLLLNGNVGYRDPSNSSTTFVGDFDLEYLLNKKGTWRLKAYNHFNDQNYYLKSALTTQGIGIVWRKEFGIPRKKEEKKEEE